MIVKRLDAIHDEDGAFCRFFLNEENTVRVESMLIQLGWYVDIYDEEVSERHSNCLRSFDRIWPMIDTTQLCNMCDRIWPHKDGVQ